MTLVFLIGLFAALCILAWIYFADEWQFRKLAPHVNSYISHRRLLLDALPMQTGKSVLDLGCGDGRMLRFFLRHKGCSTGVGYDIRRVSIAAGNLINRAFGQRKNITLYTQEYHNAILEKYDLIYLFLWADVMPGLEEWISQNIRPETIVITNTFHFPRWKPFEVLSNAKGKEVFRLYKI